ncbi:MAG: hypothetical protein AAFR71_08950 [Pseudomonadota bacterium]
MPTITYRVPHKDVNTKLKLKRNGSTTVLAEPKTNKPIISVKISEPKAIMAAVKEIVAGNVVQVAIRANAVTSRHSLGLVQFEEYDWRPVLVGDEGGIGTGAPDDDDPDDNGSGGATAMMDPVTAGVIIVGIITAGAVAWHAIDEGATFDIKVGKDGVEASVDANGPDELPDNGDNPQLPGE